MNESEFEKAHKLFFDRIGSLENDVSRCFWEIPEGPGFAYFPAVMYCFSILDYISSFWAGWNKTGPGKNQTVRLTEFMFKYFEYGSKEVEIGVDIWRHKLFHTSEPRIIKNANNGEVYVWKIGKNINQHMKLMSLADQRFQLGFDPSVFCLDLKEGVFGPRGYLQELRCSPDLQIKYESCFQEMADYSFSFKSRKCNKKKKSGE